MARVEAGLGLTWVKSEAAHLLVEVSIPRVCGLLETVERLVEDVVLAVPLEEEKLIEETLEECASDVTAEE